MRWQRVGVRRPRGGWRSCRRLNLLSTSAGATRVCLWSDIPAKRSVLLDKSSCGSEVDSSAEGCIPMDACSCGRPITSSRRQAMTAAGDDWPISYADVEPYYDRVEEFLGIYGTTENLPNLPDGKYRGPSWLTKSEQEFKHTVESRWPERHWFPGATRRPTCIGCHWASSPVRPGA